MSASREKRARKVDTPVVEAAAKQAETEKKSKTRKKVLIGVAITLVVALILGSIIIVKGPYFRKHSVAVSVGEHKLSPVTARYYYADTYSAMAQQYGDLLTYMYEPGQDIASEQYLGGNTWSSTVLENMLQQIAFDYALYDEAVRSGYELTEDEQMSLDNTRAYLQFYASVSGLTEDLYIRNVYGAAGDMETYMEYQRIKTVANAYANYYVDSLSYSADELAAAFDEAPTDYTYYTYHSYLVSSATEEEGDEAKQKAADEAREKAEALAEGAKAGLDEYLRLCDEDSGTTDYTEGEKSLRTRITGASIASNMFDWLTDPARQEGDVTTVDLEGSGTYVLYFVSADSNDYEAPDVRIVKVAPDTDDETGWANAETEANAVQDEYTNGMAADGATLDTVFPTLVLHSDDPNASYNAGHYEHVYRGQFEAVADEWIFGAHEVGDTVLVKGEEAWYFIYYGGNDGTTYRDYLVDTALRNAAYTDWTTGLTADYTAVTDTGIKYMEKSLIVSQAAQS